MRYTVDSPEVNETLTMIQRLCANPSLQNMKNYLGRVDVLEEASHETLRQIFEDVSTMTEREMDTLAAALDAESINGLDDILLFEQHIDAYTFAPDVVSDTELGRYAADAGYLSISADAAPYVDYARLGASFFDAHGGAYGPKGYVMRTESLYPVFKAAVYSRECDSSAYVILPMSDAFAEKLQAQLRVSRTCDIGLIAAGTLNGRFSELLAMLDEDCTNLRDMNELTNRLLDMQKSGGEYLKFLSALEAEQVHTFSGALDIAKELDSYTRFTGDLEEYGRDALRRMGTPQCAIDSIEGYMDLEDFGRVMMVEDDVRQTQYGLIRKDWGDSFPRPKQVMKMGGMT